eukprot:336020-Amorphochlora_amoeboformis.AAC.1
MRSITSRVRLCSSSSLLPSLDSVSPLPAAREDDRAESIDATEPAELARTCAGFLSDREEDVRRPLTLSRELRFPELIPFGYGSEGAAPLAGVSGKDKGRFPGRRTLPRRLDAWLLWLFRRIPDPLCEPEPDRDPEPRWIVSGLTSGEKNGGELGIVATSDVGEATDEFCTPLCDPRLFFFGVLKPLLGVRREDRGLGVMLRAVAWLEGLSFSFLSR